MRGMDPQSFDRILSSMCTRAHPAAREAASQFLETNPGDPASFPTIASIEHTVIETLGTITGLPEPHGYVASGGTEANVQAVHIARNVSSSPRPNIVVPESAHFSFRKAAELLQVDYREAAVDDTGRLDIDSLHAGIDSATALVVGVAGSTEHGCVDPIQAIAEIAQDAGCLTHVDAAWGGFLLPFTEFAWNFSDAPIDMLSIDPHKCGRAAIPAGGFLVRDPSLLEEITIETPYLHTKQQATLGGTRSGAGVASAASALDALWPDGYDQQYNDAISTATWLVEEFSKRDIPVNNGDLPIVTASIPEHVFSHLREEGWRISRTADGDLRIVCMPHVNEAILSTFLADLDRISITAT